ncbi:MAG TPA: CorA family divalent cation transporter [bacterium]|nr:CorA family divalent cation transporter [bacterium]HPS29827.1 CorA family divalent cation transporter [bacterium]
MKNTLLLNEIREMLHDGLYDEIKLFVESNPPHVVANFLEALKINEIVKIFSFIDEEIAAEVYAAFEDDVKNLLTKELSSRELAELLYELPDSMHSQILSTFSEEEKAKIKKLISEVDSEEQLKQEQQFAHIPGIIRDSDGTIHEGIRVYKPVNKKFKQINTLEPGGFVNVVDPDQEEIDLVCKQLNISPDFFDYALDSDERARIEDDDSNKLIIVRVPYFDETSNDNVYGTIPLGIIFSGNTIVTVCSREVVVVRKLIEKMSKNGISGLEKDAFILGMLFDTTQLFLHYLKQISNVINIVQKKIQDTSRNEDLIKLFNLEKSLVYFATSMKSNEFMTARLKKTGIVPVNDKNDDLLDDIMIESRQGIEMASIYNNIVSEMMNAFSSIISNKLSNIMKLLTIITIVLTIPLLFSSVYGMNIKLPLQESDEIFFILVILSLIIAAVTVFFFKKKDWF